jgi:hypothetical protein
MGEVKTSVAAWASAIAMVLGAAAGAWVKIAEPNAKHRAAIAELEYLRGQIEEERLHGREQPVGHSLVGTQHGMAAFSVYDSTCAKYLAPGMAVYIPSLEHRRQHEAQREALLAVEPVALAGAIGGGTVRAQACTPGCYADPATHPTWDNHVVYGEIDGRGFYKVDLIWHHGCRQRAWLHPSGQLLRAEWLCCAH